MKFGVVAARFALVLACAFATVVPAQAKFWQCAPYAREVSGIQIFGNANTWWSQAAGKYDRGQTPQVGAVLSFRSTGHMRLGHVATVASVISDREVILNHANWSRRGGVEYSARAVDVSAAGDWSMVKVTYGQGLGTTAYPTNGFIYGRGGQSHNAPGHAVPQDDDQPSVRDLGTQYASVDAGHVARAFGIRD